VTTYFRRVCVYARDILYGTHTGNLHIKINFSDLRRNEIIIMKKKKLNKNKYIYVKLLDSVFCLGAQPALWAHKGTDTYTQTHTLTAYSDMTNYLDD